MSRRADMIAAEMDRRAMATLDAIGADLAGAAARDAPIEEGTLRGTAAHRVVKTTDGGFVEVTFSTPYAARQHEEDSYEHPRGGKSHYLADQLKARTPRYVAALAQAAREAMRSAGG